MNADLLRKAAAKLRESASKASGGRWYVYEDHSDRGYASLFWVCSDQAGPITADMSEGGVCIERDSDEHGRGDADWIALANPLLAEPLAALLDTIGELFDGLKHEPAPDTWQGMGLAAARAILGEAS